jgi:site-specific DNA recombinase
MLNAYKAEEHIENQLLELDIETLLGIYKRDKSNIINKNDIDNEIARLKKQLDENNKIYKGLIRKLALEENSDLELDLKNEINNIKIENNELQSSIRELTNSVEALKKTDEFVETIRGSLSTFKKFYKLLDIEGKRLLVKSLVNNIVWYGKDEILNINPITTNNLLPQGIVKRRNI